MCIWRAHTHTQTHRYTRLSPHEVASPLDPLHFPSSAFWFFLGCIPSTTLYPSAILYPTFSLNHLASSSLCFTLTCTEVLGLPLMEEESARGQAHLAIVLMTVLFTFTYAGKDKIRADVCLDLTCPQTVAPKGYVFITDNTCSPGLSYLLNIPHKDCLLLQQIQQALN